MMTLASKWREIETHKFCKEVNCKRAALLRKICYTQLTSLFKDRQLLRSMKTRAIAQLC